MWTFISLSVDTLGTIYRTTHISLFMMVLPITGERILPCFASEMVCKPRRCHKDLFAYRVRPSNVISTNVSLEH